jgi:hypothetical protein
MISVGRDLIANQVPNAFLRIQFRMVRRQIINMDLGMICEELSDLGTLVPGGSVDIEVYFPSPDPMVQVFQERKEAFAIALGSAEQPVPTIKGFNPAKEIQSLGVLAGGGYHGLTATLHPDATEPGMLREPAFVSEYKQGKLPKSQDSVEFFLSPRRNSATPSSVA